MPTDQAEVDLDIQFEVPDDLFSLAVECDDAEAAAAHAAFLDEHLPADAPAEVRPQALAQLAAIRRELIDGQVRYLGLASADIDGHWVLCLFGVSVATFWIRDVVHPGNLLAAVLGHQLEPEQALIEEFDTPHGPAVGVRRAEVLTVPQTDPPRQVDTGAAQVVVMFPVLDVVGVVSGFCLDLDDIDLTAAVVGQIAHTLVIT